MTDLVGTSLDAPTSWWTAVAEKRRFWLQSWSQLSPRTRAAFQWTLLVLAVIVAYSYSLTTLLQSAGLETPLAYVSLVPFIALGLAALRARPSRPEPAIHDRQVDYIVGVPLVAISVVMNSWLPGRLSVMFWVWRLDILSLPFFVAGAVAIIFGTRVLWRQKLAVGYLLLAWPLPYTLLLLGVLNSFTNLTLSALRTSLRFLPVATPSQGSDSSTFSVVHQGHSFALSVVSACSGVNGMVGFLLVGVAFGAVVRGPWLRKALWLTGGMILLWLTNLARLLFIFWAGRQWGEHVAIDVLHPFVGLLVFGIGVGVMVLALRPLGLGVGPPTAQTAAFERPYSRPPLVAVPSIFGAVALLALAATVVGAANLGLRSYNLVADASGLPKLTAYTSAPVSPAGWNVRLLEAIDWAKPLFGDDSTWNRYVFLPPSGNGDVTFDDINSGDLASFSAYGIEACYQFHGFALRDVAQVSLAGGVTGQALSYSAYHQSWSIVYWIVPVKARGQAVRYERLVLYLLNSPTSSGAGLPAGAQVTNLAGSLGTSPQDRLLASNRAYLVAFADELIRTQASPTLTHLALSRSLSTGARTPIASTTNPVASPAVAGRSATTLAARSTAFVTLSQ